MTEATAVLFLDDDVPADRNLLGGKAASLISLMQLGAQVPPAFVLTTEASRQWMARPDRSAVTAWLEAGVESLERATGLAFGSDRDGLIVSVRSGAPISMPGMMDTVLNVGIGPGSVAAYPHLAGARHAFLVQYAEIVLGLDPERITAITRDVEPADLAGLQARLTREAGAIGQVWPETAMDELVGAASAVFGSWESRRAKVYRRMRNIDDALGTAVTVQQMVFGNRNARSGSGVAFTRDPTSGRPGLCGEYLTGGQGEEVVSGRQTAQSLDIWRDDQPLLFEQLQGIGRQLEADTRKVAEIEFTVEDGRLFVLQCRPALLTAKAAVEAAVALCEEGLIDRVGAVAYARAHGFDPVAQGKAWSIRANAELLGEGLAVGGGVAVGRLVLDEARLDELGRAGDGVIFAAAETSPTLLQIMQRSAGIVTMTGGATSHAAVVARELALPCVVGAEGSVRRGEIRLDASVQEGDWITIDGDRGTIYRGDCAIEASASESQAMLKLREWGR
jgi:pyruvate,orthophosphate dikinase